MLHCTHVAFISNLIPKKVEPIQYRYHASNSFPNNKINQYFSSYIRSKR